MFTNNMCPSPWHVAETSDGRQLLRIPAERLHQLEEQDLHYVARRLESHHGYPGVDADNGTLLVQLNLPIEAYDQLNKLGRREITDALKYRLEESIRYFCPGLTSTHNMFRRQHFDKYWEKAILAQPA